MREPGNSWQNRRQWKADGSTATPGIVFGLIAALLIARWAQATPVSLSLNVVGEATATVPVELIAERLSSTEPVEKRIQAAAPGETRLELEPGSWLVHVVSPGLWGRSVLITVADREQRGAMRLWPTGRLKGLLSVSEDGDSLPQRFLLQFNPAPEKGSPKPVDLEGEVVCEVVDKVWSCELPADRPLDVRLTATPFMPHFFWGLRVPRAEPLSLGTLELRRGAAVVGWVLSEDPTVDVQGTRVSLTPRTGPGVLSEEERGRLTAMGLTAKVNDRGFFSLLGVPPGDYVVEAVKEPLAPALASVRVLPNQLVEIGDPPLFLAPRRSLELYIDPPTTPDGEPWRVEMGQIDRGSSLLGPVEAAKAAIDGSFTKHEVTPGKYFLRIADGEGAHWFSEEIQLTADSSAPIFIDLPLIEARGRVLLGGEPLAARLWFGGIHGFTSLQAESDNEGSFRILLSKNGRWSIDVESDEPPVRQELHDVEVERKPGKSFAELELELPATRLRGTVVDEAGTLIPNALLDVTCWGKTVSSIQTETDDTGAFELWGLGPGMARLIAQQGMGNDEVFYSDEAEVQLEEDRDTPPVRLVLRRERKIRGQIMAGNSPVAGARIVADPAETLSFSLSTYLSDTSGNFVARVPGAAQHAFLSVSPPGFAFRALLVKLDDLPEQLVIPVGTAAGTLIVELPEDFDFYSKSSGPKLVVRHGQALASLSALWSWATFNGTQQEGQRLVVPFVEPGEYSACLLPIVERLAALANQGESEAACASGNLGAGAELTLRLGNTGRSPMEKALSP